MGSYLCSGPDLAGSSLRIQSSHIWDILSTDKIENTENFFIYLQATDFQQGCQSNVWGYRGLGIMAEAHRVSF